MRYLNAIGMTAMRNLADLAFCSLFNTQGIR
jgi:hypothetical protein